MKNVRQNKTRVKRLIKKNVEKQSRKGLKLTTTIEKRQGRRNLPRTNIKMWKITKLYSLIKQSYMTNADRHLSTETRHLGSLSHAHTRWRPQKAPAPCTPPCFARELPPIIRPFIRICLWASSSAKQPNCIGKLEEIILHQHHQPRKPSTRGRSGMGRHWNHWKSQSQQNTHTHTPTTSWMTPSINYHHYEYFLFGNKVVVRVRRKKKT